MTTRKRAARWGARATYGERQPPTLEWRKPCGTCSNGVSAGWSSCGGSIPMGDGAREGHRRHSGSGECVFRPLLLVPTRPRHGTSAARMTSVRAHHSQQVRHRWNPPKQTAPWPGIERWCYVALWESASVAVSAACPIADASASPFPASLSRSRVAPSQHKGRDGSGWLLGRVRLHALKGECSGGQRKGHYEIIGGMQRQDLQCYD